jgi:predicted transcriptional regulator
MMESGRESAYVLTMASKTDVWQQSFPPNGLETEAVGQARVEREEAIIAKAEADIDDGLGIDDDEVEAWLDSLDRNSEAALPSPRRGQISR